MISFRFHLVSMVAVFLALGLGVLTGTTVLNRGIVVQLERQTEALEEGRAQLRETVEVLRAQQEEWTRFGETIAGPLVGGRLSGTEVVLLTQEGTEGSGVEGARDALGMAGARIRMELSVNARMTLEEEADVETLAGLLGLRSTAEPEEVAERAAQRLADQLAFGTIDSDVLTGMAEAGFLVRQGADPAESPSVAEPLIVVVAGGSGDPVIDPEWFLVPVVERLALDGAAVGASEPRVSDYEFVTVLRGNDVAQRIVTQDNVDELPGEVGLVLGLENLLTEGEPGHYGVKAGASELLPPPS